MNTYTKTRTFVPSEVIPAHTLGECGESEMQKEFSGLVRNMGGIVRVDGWTVTIEMRTDDEASYAEQQLEARLGSIPERCIKAFS